MIDGKINSESFLPPDTDLVFLEQEQEIIKNIKAFPIELDDLPDNEAFSNAIKSTGQLLVFVVYKFPKKGYYYKNVYCSFSILKLQDRLKILTVLHALQFQKKIFLILFLFLIFPKSACKKKLL